MKRIIGRSSAKSSSDVANNTSSVVSFVEENEADNSFTRQQEDAATNTSFSLRSFRSLPSPRFFRLGKNKQPHHQQQHEPLEQPQQPPLEQHTTSTSTTAAPPSAAVVESSPPPPQQQQQLEALLSANHQLVQQSISQVQDALAQLAEFEQTVQRRVKLWLVRSAAVPLAVGLALASVDLLVLAALVLAVVVMGELVLRMETEGVLSSSSSSSDSSSPVAASLGSAIASLQRVTSELPKEKKQDDEVTASSSSSSGAPASASSSMIKPGKDGAPLDMTGYQLNVFAGLPSDVLSFERDVLSKLTSDQQRAYAQLHRINTTRADAFTQLRFLQADKYDVDKAHARLKNTCQWRDRLMDPFLADMNWALVKRAQALRPRTYCGLDKLGRPVYAEKLGEFFSNDEAHRALSLDQWILTYSFEMCEINNEFRLGVLNGKPYSHRICYIADIGGLRLSFFRVVPLLKSLVKEVETHFPEMAGPVMLVNCPAFVTRAWGLVKKFLDPATAEKISFYGNLSTYQGALCDVFGEDTVPVEYGGRNPIKVACAPKNCLSADFNRQYPFEE